MGEDILQNHESELIEAQLRAVSSGISEVGEDFVDMDGSPLLAKGLKNADPVIRRYAAESLAGSDVCATTLVPDLLCTAADDDADVRVAARHTLRAVDDTGDPRFRAIKHVVVPMMFDRRKSPGDILVALMQSDELLSELRRIAEKRCPGEDADSLLNQFLVEHQTKMLHRGKLLRFDITRQEKFHKWIAEIFRNHLRDIQRAYSLSHTARQFSSFSRPPTISADDAPLSHVMAQREMALLLNRLLQDLPARERQVLRARFLQGLTIRKAAEVLSLSKNKVETSLNRGLRQLRSRIKQELPQYAQLVDGGESFF